MKRVRIHSLALFTALAVAHLCHAQIITTFAGSCPAATPRVCVQFVGLQGLAFDSAGNLYIVDAQNEDIVKIDTAGNVSTVAGTAEMGGYSGDGGRATSAKLSQPIDVALDGAGNLYIADYSNNVVRKVDASGIISTFAGNTNCNYTGDEGAATSATLCTPFGVSVDRAGDVYIVDTGNNVIRKVDKTGKITAIRNGNV